MPRSTERADRLTAEIEGEGLSGFGLCVHIKMTLRLKYIPVMLTTGSAYLSDYLSAHSLEAVVCLAKPFRQDRSHMCAPVRSREPSGLQVPSLRRAAPTRRPRRHRKSNRR